MYSAALQRTSNGAEIAARWAAIALGFSIPVSVALDGALAAAVLLGCLFAARYPQRFSAMFANPVAQLAVALFALYAAAGLYSDGTRSDIAEFLGKAGRLLFIPLLISLFDDPAVRRRAWRAFMAAMLLTLALSYALWLDLLPAGGTVKGEPANPVVFKLHITQNLFMAFTAFACAVQARHAPSRRQAAAWGTLAFLAAVNVLFLVHGRTGHLVLLVLLVYLLTAWLRWKGIAAAAAAICAIAAFAYLAPNTALYQRTVLAYQEFSGWKPSAAAAHSSSVGLRLEYYRNTLEIIRQHPLTGTGTGGFRQAYARQVEGTGRIATHNPHNEFLMTAAQLGLAGLALLLYLLWTQWRLAARLASAQEQMLARGLVLTIVTASAVSSTLIDHAEGWFYVWMSALFFAGLKSRQPDQGKHSL